LECPDPSAAHDLLEKQEAVRAAPAEPPHETEIGQLRALISWTLGEHETDAFPMLPDDWPRRKFYWRGELRRRFEAILPDATTAQADLARLREAHETLQQEHKRLRGLGLPGDATMRAGRMATQDVGAAIARLTNSFGDLVALSSCNYGGSIEGDLRAVLQKLEQAEAEVVTLRETLAQREAVIHALDGELQTADRLHTADTARLSDLVARLREHGQGWKEQAESWRQNKGQRTRGKTGWEVLDACGSQLLAALLAASPEAPRG
jgi:hypothetical protein